METVLEKINVEKYSDYKDSGVEWIGEVPAHWITLKAKYLWKEKVDLSQSGDETLLSVSQYVGVNNREEESRSESLIGYKRVSENDLVINIMLAWLGGLGISPLNGVVSPAYAVYKLTYNADSRFLHYLYRTETYLNEFARRSKGVVPSRWRMYNDDFGQVLTVLPPKEEQTTIAAFLDRKTAQIDKAIAIKEKQIELLKERRQILSHKAVTCGLNPDAPMKDSGVEWLGEIPAHWEVKGLKYVLAERNERSITGEEPLFMVSQTYGLVVRADYHEKAEVAQTSVGAKFVYQNDLVFNKLKAHLGVFFKSDIEFQGLVSPDYAVYYSLGIITDLKYLEILFRHPAYIGQFICKATGIVEGLIRLYTGDLFSIKIPVPPQKEQNDILDYIKNQTEKTTGAILIKEKEIERLKEYKATLINSAVTGQIKVCYYGIDYKSTPESS